MDRWTRIIVDGRGRAAASPVTLGNGAGCALGSCPEAGDSWGWMSLRAGRDLPKPGRQRRTDGWMHRAGHGRTAASLPTASPRVPQDGAGGSCGWIKRSQVSSGAGGAEAGPDPTLGAAVLVIPPRGLGETFIPCFRANPWAGGAQRGRPGPVPLLGVWGRILPLPAPRTPMATFHPRKPFLPSWPHAAPLLPLGPHPAPPAAPPSLDSVPSTPQPPKMG